MERISPVLLNNALTAPEAGLQKSLSSGDLSILLAEMDELIRRYPSQGQEESIDVYQADFERLSVKYSLPKVRAALLALRVSSEQHFFPRPDEVAAELERQAAEENAVKAKKRSRRLLDEMEVTFWEWVDCRMRDEDTAGMTEQQFLDTIKTPGYTGRKARKTQ